MNSHPDRVQLYGHCMDVLSRKSDDLRAAIESVQQAANAETKSTAGDKHETARAMAQLEVEMLSRQLSEVNKSMDALKRLHKPAASGDVQAGSLVATSIGNFYISVSIGTIEFQEVKVVAISPEAPLAKAIIGRKAGDEMKWSGKTLAIISVFN